VRGLDLLFALRPLLWVQAVALYGAGGASDHPATGWLLGDRELWALLLLLGAVHLANGWRDREGDRWNRKGFPVAAGDLGGRPLLVLGAAATGGAAMLAFGCSARSQALLVAAAALGAAYTMPPLELKRRAGLDLLAHAVGYGVIAFLLGAEGAGALDGTRGVAPIWLASLPYALGIGSVAVRTMLADREGDAAAGQRTLAVRWGVARAARLAAGLAWATMATGLALADWVPLLWGFVAGVKLSLPAAVEEERSAARAPIGLQALFLALLAPRSPEPLAFALVVGLSSAVYYGRRWGIPYPIRIGRAVVLESGGGKRART